MEINRDAERPVYVVMVRSAAGNITALATPVRELDADFAGTRVTTADLDALWLAGGSGAPPQTILPLSIFASLALGPGSLPSGNGTPGGDFSSAFTY